VLRSIALATTLIAGTACDPAGEPAPDAAASGPFSELSRAELERRLEQIEGYAKYLQHLQISFGGVALAQSPTDVWILQELISSLRPDFVIETGTYRGGSALFFAAALELVNDRAKVITVDIDPQVEDAARHALFRRRVQVITGDSVAPEVIEQIAAQVEGKTVFVTLDALHSKAHVARELELYSPFVSVGSYIVVQDTFFEGPRAAISEFLPKHPDFEIDRSPERYLYSKFQSGFLKRVR
jgi:cephalosporin hydroxylase